MILLLLYMVAVTAFCVRSYIFLPQGVSVE